MHRYTNTFGNNNNSIAMPETIPDYFSIGCNGNETLFSFHFTHISPGTALRNIHSYFAVLGKLSAGRRCVCVCVCHGLYTYLVSVVHLKSVLFSAFFPFVLRFQRIQYNCHPC